MYDRYYHTNNFNKQLEFWKISDIIIETQDRSNGQFLWCNNYHITIVVFGSDIQHR